MVRSIWKGPFIQYRLLKNIFKLQNFNCYNFKVYSKNCIIFPNFFGQIFEIHNGYKFTIVCIKKNMIGAKFGQFVLTRKSINNILCTKKTIVNSIHLMQNKNWASIWYIDYYMYIVIFRLDFSIYFYIRSLSKIKYNIIKKSYFFEIEIVNCFIYRTKKNIILNLHIVYLKKMKLSKKSVKFFIKRLLIKLKQNFFFKKNQLLVAYKIGKNTGLFMAIKICKLIEKRIRFQSKIIEKIIKKVCCLGICVLSKGRMNIFDRSKKSKISFGSIPVQTIEANIDYGFAISNSKKGLQSIKIWIFKK
jgi:small subunit ribosomal protein S19